MCRCSYQYDPIGNLYQKVCDDIYNTNYLVDPFGPFGPDIIAEVSECVNLYHIMLCLTFCFKLL